MAYRVRHAIEIVASLDTDENQASLKRTVTAQITNTRDDPVEGIVNTLIVADAVSDLALSLGGVTTGSVLYIEVDREVTIKINGGTEALKLVPYSTFQAKLLWEGEFTALTVSNASGAVANLTYMVAGV